MPKLQTAVLLGQLREPVRALDLLVQMPDQLVEAMQIVCWKAKMFPGLYMKIPEEAGME
ncbi:hypothetical protein ACTNE3_11440 [Bacillota bacterium HCP3S3_F1_1]